MKTDVLRGSSAVVGIHESFCKRGESTESELQLTLRAIVDAAEDAGISAKEIDGFVSYGGGDNDGTTLAAHLMVDRLRWSNMVWGGGGGGAAAALINATVAIATGQAECVVVYKAMSQQDSGRLGYAKSYFTGHMLPHGVGSPAHVCALRSQRMIEHEGVSEEALKAVVMADYHHAQQVPVAASYGRPVGEAEYEKSRMIVEPFRLYDCSRENDGAVALIMVSAERARQLRPDAAYYLAGSQGSHAGYSTDTENDDAYATAGFGGSGGVAERLWESADIRPDDIDVVQVYENFSGSAVAALIDHGLCGSGPEAQETLTLENLIAPHGRLPMNTSGGNLAGSFVNGMGLAVEAVRQIRGSSHNPVPDVQTSLFIGGPTAALSSSVIFCTLGAL